MLFGQLDGPQVAGLEEHFADCPRCLERAECITPDDTLVAALAGADTVSHVQGDKYFEQLRNDLLMLYRQHMQESVEPTVSNPAIASTDKGPNDFANLLLPPAELGEIGRIGTFRVVELLGKGGMGIVLRAIDERLQRPVALTVMKPGIARDAVARERFLREARAAAAIDHDHVVTIYQVGEENEIPFIAMQLLSGESLEGRLKRVERLSVDESLRITREAAAGLSAAHQRRLLHRDVKPDNIWLEAETGRVKILDFGLARAVEPEGKLTEEGMVVGTVNYMSPEQVRGKSLDERCGLFSLGSVLYLMLSGRLPFKRNTLMATMHATASAEHDDLRKFDPEIPSPVVDLVNRLLEKDPE